MHFCSLTQLVLPSRDRLYTYFSMNLGWTFDLLWSIKYSRSKFWNSKLKPMNFCFPNSVALRVMLIKPGVVSLGIRDYMDHFVAHINYQVSKWGHIEWFILNWVGRQLQSHELIPAEELPNWAHPMGSKYIEFFFKLLNFGMLCYAEMKTDTPPLWATNSSFLRLS